MTLAEALAVPAAAAGQTRADAIDTILHADGHEWVAARQAAADWPGDVAMAQDRISVLVGRDVYTHELALDVDGLLAEARGDAAPRTTDDVVNLLRKSGKPVAVKYPDGRVETFPGRDGGDIGDDIVTALATAGDGS